MPEPRKNKFVITLENIDIEYVLSKYNLSNNTTSQKTKISELNETNTHKTMTFFGISKQIHKCNISMIDKLSGQEINSNKYSCFWCRNAFNNIPIGCPISHTPYKITTKYKSMINQNEYEIKEPSNTNTDKSTYTTNGAFCSFNCYISYINDNKNNPLYDQSAILLMRMYKEMFGKNANIIPPAPHWILLKEYGGHLDINEFREGFDKVEYQNHGIIKEYLKSVVNPVAHLHEKKLKF